MFGSILGSIGGFIGGAFGGGILSSAGRFIGRWIGDQLDESDDEIIERYRIGRTIDNFYPESSALGQVIPLVFGQVKVNGNLIWCEPIKEVPIENCEAKYFSSRRVNTTKISYSYYASFAIGICEGEIQSINRVWAAGELLDLSQYKYRLYRGTEEQMPDPLIIAVEGEHTPAFRDLSYIVFEDFPLLNFGNKIPHLAFEVYRKPNIPEMHMVEDLVKDMIMIPGSGEFVYDTIIQYKRVYAEEVLLFEEVINSHNQDRVANSIYSLNQLQQICSNIKWIAPVVTWFGNNKNLNNCEIVPAVEFNDKSSNTSEEWRVADFTRENAWLISKDKYDSPNYGGTVNDASVIRYLEEIRRRNLKIMFYPMFFQDVPGKPWRGRLKGTPEEVVNFFNRKNGYKNFILHYANLVKGKVDAFVIGSELIGLTTVKNGEEFPAVKELVDLAQKVKAILGPEVIITYAADWSEYHHCEGGWYHLDELWANPAIDVVGIDNYFPITRTITSDVTYEDIARGMNSGEGYDFYYNSEGEKQPLAPDYAWKNLRWWWENEHINPNGTKTSWRSKMKKIWFTEFGFPSIDKASNQPNVFYDPNCVDGNIPLFSSGETDFAIQRRSIKAAYEYWQKEEYIEHMFLWTWDARPYPAWPHMAIWRDGYLWEKGHWVNNKFGIASLAAILIELSLRAGLEFNKINANSLDESLNGVAFNQPVTIWQAVNLLRCAYFFDVNDYQQGGVIFRKRKSTSTLSLSSNDFIKQTDEKFFEKIDIDQANKINKLCITYFNNTAEYDYSFAISSIDSALRSNAAIYHLKLPVVYSEGEATTLTDKILNNIKNESAIFAFQLPDNYVFIQPGDLLKIQLEKTNFVQVRVVNTSRYNDKLQIVAICEIQRLFTQVSPVNLAIPKMDKGEIIALNLPSINGKKGSFLAFASSFTGSEILSLSITGEEYFKTGQIKGGAFGKVISYHTDNNTNISIIDELSYFIIFSERSLKSPLAEELWTIKSLALIGEELVFYGKVEKLDDKIYKISRLMRGAFATEDHLFNHNISEDFILLSNIKEVEVDEKLVGNKIYYKTYNSPIKEVILKGKSLTPSTPLIMEHYIKDNILTIKWVARDCYYNDSLQVPESYSVLLNQNFVESSQELKTYIINNSEISINLIELGVSDSIKISIISHISNRASAPAILKINI